MIHKDNLIWVDLEMTGLNPKKNRIIEIATLITDAHLNVLAEGPVIAIKQPDALLDAMDDWCTRVHTQTGLVKKVKNSRYTEVEAETLTLDFISQYQKKGYSPICGNSIGQDRRFLEPFMPTLHDFFHYRNLDVSTVKELARRWKPELLKKLTKKSTHKALDDIRDSLKELRLYRDEFFNI